MRTIFFATWLRVMAMLFIVIGHCVLYHPNTLVQSSFQFFNVANEIFFMLSGFLFGVTGIKGGYANWFMRRTKRIYVPYLLFVLILGALALLNGTNIWHWRWLHLLLGIQGTYVGITEAPHTWFVSAILLCYLFTPLFDIVTSKVKCSTRLSILYCLLLFSLPLLFAYIEDACYWMMGTAVGCYGLAFFCGNVKGTPVIKRKGFAVAVVLMILAIVVRLVGKYYYDDTVFYDRILSMYSHIVLAISISCIMIYLFNAQKPSPVVEYLSNISFEVYLYHYLFLEGLLAVYGYINNWYIGTVMVIILAFIIASLMNFIVERMK